MENYRGVDTQAESHSFDINELFRLYKILKKENEALKKLMAQKDIEIEKRDSLMHTFQQ